MKELYINSKGYWSKTCPKCAGEQCYETYQSAEVCFRANSQCMACSNAQKKGKKKPNYTVNPLSRPHDPTHPTVVSHTTLKRMPTPVTLRPYKGIYISITMYPVTVKCPCGFSTKRKVPLFPFSVHWHCSECGTHNKNVFELAE